MHPFDSPAIAFVLETWIGEAPMPSTTVTTAAEICTDAGVIPAKLIVQIDPPATGPDECHRPAELAGAVLEIGGERYEILPALENLDQATRDEFAAELLDLVNGQQAAALED